MQTEKFVLVDLFLLGEETLIARSQAKQILKDLGEFQRIVLDFNKVRLVGQGFVDEVFRVYTRHGVVFTIEGPISHDL